MRALLKQLGYDGVFSLAHVLFLLATAAFHFARRGIPQGAGNIWLATVLFLLVFSGYFLVGPRRLSLRIFAHLLFYSVLYGILDAFVPTLGNRDEAEFLRHADRLLFGFVPAEELHRVCPVPLHEIFAIGYTCFLPYLYFNAVRAMLRDPPAVAKRFVAGFAVLYAVGYLGYVFLPANGPRFSHPEAFQGITEGPLLSRALSLFMDRFSGHRNVFPSLHGGASLYLWIFEYRYRSRKLALCSLPVVIGIWVGTIYHGYHYVVDLLGGLVLVVLGHLVARLAVRTPRLSRRSAGHVGGGRVS